MAGYEPITLEEMGSIRLMSRTDTKFVTTERQLRQLLLDARDYYRVQEVEGRREASYYTLYYDTADCAMFRAHRNGKLDRQKLRIRSYVDSDIDFLEVKSKDNHGVTRKERMAMSAFDAARCGVLEAACGSQAPYCERFLSRCLRYDPRVMRAKIENRFLRVTLVDKGMTERLTIDRRLAFHNINTGGRASLPGVVVIELKRAGKGGSPMMALLRRQRIMPMAFSKYCIGMALTDSELRCNRLMPRISRIEKIMTADAVDSGI